MTVETISEVKLKEILDNMGETGITVMGITVANTVLVNIPQNKWKFIKKELNALPDMTFNCMEFEQFGVPSKQFIFTSINREQVTRVVNFIDKTINVNSDVAVVCSSPKFEGEDMYGARGNGANCPLFSGK